MRLWRLSQSQELTPKRGRHSDVDTMPAIDHAYSLYSQRATPYHLRTSCLADPFFVEPSLPTTGIFMTRDIPLRSVLRGIRMLARIADSHGCLSMMS